MRLLPLLLAAASLAAADPLVSWQRRLNLTLLEFQHGGGELEILNPSTFRFVRCRAKPCAGRLPAPEPVPFKTAETSVAFQFNTAYLEIRIRKNDGGLMVKSRHGVQMLDEIVRPGEAPRGISFERRAPEGERLYGLGPRTDRELNLRGKAIATKHPLLISSLGYGLWFPATTDYRFDLAHTAADKVSIAATIPDRLEMYFHYGPTPKEVLEENFAVAGWTFLPALEHGEPLPRYATKVDAMPFPDLLAWLAHASMSGTLVPAFDQTAVTAPAAQYLPVLYGAPVTPLRRTLRPYLYTYLTEAKDRGFPLFRPMAMQYPKDLTAAGRLDQFMLGDELLVATGDEVYLPMGIWTDLRTNEPQPGRRAVAVAKAEGVAIYAKNGMIVPLEQPDGVMHLHYFPRLGAEFFLSEPGHVQPTQVHAGPAAGVLRLEIESRVARKYEWIVHHVSPAEKVEPPGHRYDAVWRTLHVPVDAKAMGDSIVNVTLEVPLEP